MRRGYDLAVVGAGVLGLGCALAAARLGRRVVVIERDSRANGASVRNFGFVTVTGQERGAMWRRARRSRRIWGEVVRQARIPVQQSGLWVAVRRREARDVLEAFLQTEMGEGCALLDRQALRSQAPELAGPDLLGALWSPHELRVESRTAIPQLTTWLETVAQVDFLWGAAVRDLAPGGALTSRGRVEAEAVIVCPGDDLSTLFPETMAAAQVTRCKLQMLRLAPPRRRLSAAVMSDLGLTRYAGYAALSPTAALAERLAAEQPHHLAHGVHLIAVQGDGGELVVGDSHHYGPTPDPFGSEAVDRLILEEFAAVFGEAAPPVRERWTGTYAWAPERTTLVEAPLPGVRLMMVTTGAGASTGFGLAEEVVGELFGKGSAACPAD